jgi:hypothetical protein
MRKLWKKGIFIFLVILFMMAIIFLGFVVIGHKCTDYDDSRSLLVNNLENAISQYQAGEISVIDFSSLTDFTWDRLFIFGPYTSSKTINNNLGTLALFPFHTHLLYRQYEFIRFYEQRTRRSAFRFPSNNERIFTD